MKTLNPERFNASVQFTFPVVLIATLGCFHLFKQRVTYMIEDYDQMIRSSLVVLFLLGYR